LGFPLVALPWSAVEPLGKRLARAIRQQRQQRRLTQLALAERAELSLDTVSRVERGRRELSLRAVDQLARALGVDPVDLLAGGGR
jgi:transcriptional regulator with XRE-family HTH domain